MRTNLPITQREYQFPDGETLLSATDTSSHSQYPNAAAASMREQTRRLMDAIRVFSS